MHKKQKVTTIGGKKFPLMLRNEPMVESAKELIQTTNLPDIILLDVKSGSKKQLIEALAFKAAEILGLDGQYLMEVLLDREQIGSTGIGYGVAIPHIKLPTLTGLHGVFARLKTPVEFNAVDNRPVDLVYLILAPESSGGDHLRELARVSRLMRDPDIVADLRLTTSAADAAEIFNAFEQDEDIVAA